MKTEMAGKILSDVKGSSETKEATANELKATRTVQRKRLVGEYPGEKVSVYVRGIPIHNAVLTDYLVDVSTKYIRSRWR